MMDLVVSGGRVYAGERLQSIDIFIKGGKIAAMGGPHRAHDRIDASGMMVLPGAIDIHVHFRDPGLTHKEDWESGSISAAAGGVTTAVDQPNTIPSTSDAKAYEEKLWIARHRSIVDFCINGAPGKVEELVRAGAIGIGEIFTYEFGEAELLKKLREVERCGALPTVHAEDGAIIKRHSDIMAAEQSADVHSRVRPPAAEEVAIDWILSAASRVHICHLSTAGGLDLVRRAKATGRMVTCEVAPHHLLLNRRDYKKQGTFLKMNPPLRDARDNDALWEGLATGAIDAIASDHAPHLPEEKKDDLWHAPAGVPGVETMLPLMLAAIKGNLISLDRVVDALSVRPAEIFGLAQKGRIAAGMDADLVFIDPRARTEISARRLHSRADWTPYEGRTAIFPKMTMVRGEVVFDGDLMVRPGFGRNIPGPGLRKAAAPKD